MSKHRHHDHSNPIDRYSRVLTPQWVRQMVALGALLWGIIILGSIWIHYGLNLGSINIIISHFWELSR